MLSFNGKSFRFQSSDVLQIVCLCILISACLAQVYYDPIYKGPIYKSYYKGPYYKGIYKEPYYKGIYKGPIYKGYYEGPIYDADDEYTGYEYGVKKPGDGEKLIDYWNTFKEIFLQSYADLKKPYVVEKPVPVPVPVDRVRTIVKKYPVPVFIKPQPSLVVIKRYKKHH